MKDSALLSLYRKELKRQASSLSLIPSENYVSGSVLDYLGSVLTNKYSEGYPGKRYYPGNALYDEIERLAQERALSLFGLSEKEWSVNVQAYSGSPANLAVYFGLLEAHDCVLGFQLSAGGHLTHGHRVNFSGTLFQSFQYGVSPDTGLLDYDQIKTLARAHKPKLIVSGLTAYPQRIDFKTIGEIAHEAGAYHLADISHVAGLVAAQLFPSPFEHADIVTTTTHKTLRGPRGALIFSRRKETKDGKTIAERIDRAVFPGLQGGPHNNTTAAIAVALGEALSPSFSKYQKQTLVNSLTLARSLASQGFTLTTGGTANHLMVVDLRPRGIDGATAEALLEKNGILANRNSLPSDDKPFKPNGLRLGTPAVTTRGMKEKEMESLGTLIAEVLLHKKNIRAAIEKMCRQFPVPSLNAKN